MNQSNNFRYDINGLRAYAVGLVVLFHFNVFGFSGGFIGVDIFFVISGFLMTKIIVSGIQKETFNFLNFYISRANRIIPALLILILAVTAVGWFTLLPSEYKDFSKHSIASLAFISNIQYFLETGYFDATAHEKLLLHTWSLSVEWQFYIILPIFLYLIAKLTKSLKTLKILYVVGFIVSLCLAIFASKNYLSASFYLLPTRAWEMMAGGIIFLFFNQFTPKDSHKKYLESLGFLLIGISTLIFTGATAWPSYNALLPVFGTFLILIAQNNNSIFTNNKTAQFLGDTSYSIYLWHWPIVFYLAYFEKQDNIIFIAAAILLSVILGWLSFKLIENPTRKYLSKLTLVKAYITTFIYLAIPILILSFIFIKQGLPSRLDKEVIEIANTENDKNPRRSECHISKGNALPKCQYGSGSVAAIVVGDSHAQAIVRTVEKSLHNSNLSVLDWTYSSCPTIIGTKNIGDSSYKCGEIVEQLINEKSKYHNVPIIITNRLNTYFEGDQLTKNQKPQIYSGKYFDSYSLEMKQNLTNRFVDTVCKLTQTNPVYITTQIPEQKFNVPKTLGHRYIYGNHNEAGLKYSEYLTRSKDSNYAIQLAAEKCGAKVLDVTPYLCDSNICSATINGKPAYYDDDHLSETGAKKLIPLFKKVFSQ